MRHQWLALKTGTQSTLRHGMSSCRVMPEAMHGHSRHAPRHCALMRAVEGVRMGLTGSLRTAKHMQQHFFSRAWLRGQRALGHAKLWKAAVSLCMQLWKKARGRTGGGVWEERLGKHHIIHGHVSSSSATALTLARAVREDPAYSRDKRSVPQVLRSAERKTGTHAWHATC